MTKYKKEKNGDVTSTQAITKCPHCGVNLSSWEQVLLNVDRALMCKNCWYRIILDVGKPRELDRQKSKGKQ
jgi:DNA-directed RNA polymerase subunit RPC12/RpoP